MPFSISNRSHYAGLILDLAYSGRSGDSTECQAIDIVADIIHLCDKEGLSFAEIIRMAEIHHQAELLEKDSDETEATSAIH